MSDPMAPRADVSDVARVGPADVRTPYYADDLVTITARHTEDLDHVTVAGYGLGRCAYCGGAWPCDASRLARVAQAALVARGYLVDRWAVDLDRAFAGLNE